MSVQHKQTELWKDCVRWLARCDVISQENEKELRQNTLAHFAQLLRDGQLLCDLANKLSPGCINTRMIDRRPQLSHFACLKNIEQFLATCRDVFQLTEEDLFASEDLFRVADFGKVLKCLSKLSSCQLIQQAVVGFTFDHEAQSMERVYQNLVDTFETVDIAENPYSRMFDDNSEKIYQDLIQRPRQIELDDIVPQNSRHHCLKEIINSERNYVDMLRVLLDKFYTPLKDVMPYLDHLVVFRNLKELLPVHEELLVELTKSVRQSVNLDLNPFSAKSDNVMSVGEVFVRFELKFRVYKQFVVLGNEAISRLAKLESQIGVREKINECENNAAKNLQQLIAVPWQRILKYHLLLEQLLKHTPDTYPEREQIRLGYEAMLDTGKFLNQAANDEKDKEKLTEIQNSIRDLRLPTNKQFSDLGRSIMDGEISVYYNHESQIRPKAKYVFLFQKAIVLCNRLSDVRFRYEDVLFLQEYKLQKDISSPTTGSNIWATLGNSIKLRKPTHNWRLTADTRTITFCCHSAETKQTWLTTIEQQQDSIFENAARTGDHVLNLHTFGEPTECTVCQTFLLGIFFQGYRCVHCKCAVHKECVRSLPDCHILRDAHPVRRNTNRRESRHATTTAENSDVGQWYISVQPYKCPEVGYLEFSQNDLIEVLSTESTKQGYWLGRHTKTNLIGLFPASYVREERRNVRKVTSPTVGVAASSHVIVEGQNSQVSPRFSSESRNEYLNQPRINSPWFSDCKDRNEATDQLRGKPRGTFMVRYSQSQQAYAISLSSDFDTVKHMLINEKDGQFFLDAKRKFDSVSDLVTFYSRHSLQEIFQGVDLKLTNYNSN